VAAWRAANAAKDTADVARDEFSIQAKQLAERDLPRLHAVFHVERLKLPLALSFWAATQDELLYLDVSNYGGVDTNLRITEFALISNPLDRDDVCRKTTKLVKTSSPFIHGIDTLRPNETVGCLISSVSRKWIYDQTVREIAPKIAGDVTNEAMLYRLVISCDQFPNVVEFHLVLDQTTWMRSSVNR
jgi:hypothetical protein